MSRKNSSFLKKTSIDSLSAQPRGKCKTQTAGGAVEASSSVRGPDVDQRGQQQELGRFVQQHQVVAPQAVVMHPVSVDLEGCGIMMLVSVEERRTLQRIPVRDTEMS